MRRADVAILQDSSDLAVVGLVEVLLLCTDVITERARVKIAVARFLI